MSCDAVASRVFPYVDGELDPELRGEVETHLAQCPSCRRMVEQEVAFRSAYVTRLHPDPAPPHVRAKVERLLDGLARHRVRRRRPRYTPLAYAAAALLLVAIGVGIGMNVTSVLERRAMLSALTEASVDQHQKLVRGLLPPDIAGVSPKAAEEWLRQRLDYNVTLPAPPSAHATLLGARISHLVNVPVAAVGYRVEQSHVSLFVIPEQAYQRLGLSEKPKFKVLKHRGYDVIVWRQHGTGYALVSEIGGRSCLVCHAPSENVDTHLTSPDVPRL